MIVNMTNGEIDKLGTRIGNSSEVTNEDLDRLQEYRQTFQQPLSRVFSFVLSAARKLDRQCIVTYRIKRIDTIIEKLRRFKKNENGKMTLSRMWDIAGCRCILSAPGDEKIYQLRDIILNEFGDCCKVNDRIARPQASGYRSLHVYVKDKQTQKPIEIQIRNKSHHNWATLVEIVDLLYGSQNKEQGEKGQLGRFLYLFSKAKDLSSKEFSEMLTIERRMKVFEKMSRVLTGNYLNIRQQWMQQQQLGCYYVITANKKESEILSFPTFEKAESAYYEKYLANSDCNIVLTHIQNPEFEQISMAYSNYILAVHAFFDDYRSLLADRIVESLKSGNYHRFIKLFRIYNYDVKSHFENMSLEVDRIQTCSKNPRISRNQINKWIKEIKIRIMRWRDETIAFGSRLHRVSLDSRFKNWLVGTRIKRLAKAVSDGQSVLRNNKHR